MTLTSWSPALRAVPEQSGKPTLVILNTTKGKGVSFAENVPAWHHHVPDDEQLRLATAELEAAIAAVTAEEEGGTTMANNIPNRQAMCETLIELAEHDRDIMVLASDSRGSAAMAPFVKQYPEQFVETGIAEQNIVGIAAGLAHSGKKPFVTSPACFLSMRSIEQMKVDVAYSGTNVKLVGISGGVSYGALGMSHHLCRILR